MGAAKKILPLVSLLLRATFCIRQKQVEIHHLRPRHLKLQRAGLLFQGDALGIRREIISGQREVGGPA